MADTDVLIKDLPLTETVNDSDDLVTEDSSPTTHRIKASVVKNYINTEQNEELDGLKADLDNVNSNIGSLSSKVDDAATTVSSMQTNLNSMDGRVQANADGISELNSALADLNSDVSNALLYKGTYTGSYDDLGKSDSGIYNISGRTVATSTEQWGYFIHLGMGTIIIQIFFPSQAAFYVRYYAGNPSAWSAWRMYSGTSV